MQTKHRCVSQAPTDRKFKRYARRMSEDSESLGDEQVSDVNVENDHALRVPVKANQVQKVLSPSDKAPRQTNLKQHLRHSLNP